MAQVQLTITTFWKVATSKINCLELVFTFKFLENTTIRRHLVATTDYATVKWDDYSFLKTNYGIEDGQPEFVDDVTVNGDVCEMKNEPRRLELECNQSCSTNSCQCWDERLCCGFR